MLGGMTPGRDLRLAALCFSLSACGQSRDAGEPGDPPPEPAAPRATEQPAPSETGDAPQPEESTPPAALAFDPKTVKEIEGRIVTLYGSDTWSLCGVIHSVGAVEVLGVGEPPPHMVLFVSCPADMGNRDVLKKGKRIRALLYAGKRGWPKPAGEIPPALPIRYAKNVMASPSGD